MATTAKMFGMTMPEEVEQEGMAEQSATESRWGRREWEAWRLSRALRQENSKIKAREKSTPWGISAPNMEEAKEAVRIDKAAPTYRTGYDRHEAYVKEVTEREEKAAKLQALYAKRKFSSETGQSEEEFEKELAKWDKLSKQVLG